MMRVGFRDALIGVCKVTKRPMPYFETVRSKDKFVVEVIVNGQPVRGEANNLEDAKEQASQVGCCYENKMLINFFF